MKRLKNYLEIENKKTFLDIGTGTGNFIHFIKSMYDDFDRMIGIDIYEHLIETAKNHNQDERVSFEVMDAYHTTYNDNTFDVVMLSNSLHHLEDIEGILTEMKRIVKDDGILLVSEMMANKLDNKQISHKLLHHFAAKLDRLHGDIHHDTFTDDEIIYHLTESKIVSLKDKWFLEVPRKEENTQEEMNQLVDILDRVSSRIPDDRTDLLEEKEKIKKYIQENGYDGCTTLFVVLKK